jgi:hypothetical protein
MPVMDDPQPNPSETPDYQAKRDEVAALRTPPGQAPPPGAAFASEPIVIEPVSDAATPAARPISVPPPTDHMPGDAAPTPLIPLKEEPQARRDFAVAGDTTPNAVIIRPPHPTTAALAAGPRAGSFALWAIIWVAAWAGVIALSFHFHHRFDRRFDWNTSYFSIAARNLVKDGLVADRGGLYLTAGDFKGQDDREFYAGHPPLTAWLLAGWMRAFGTSDLAIRALPLTFSALNLLLLYVLVRRIFGPPAALAATVLCALLPMTAYYGQVVNMEPFVLTFMLGAAIGYVGWVKNSSAFGFLLLCVCVILGCWTDWPIYIFTGLLAVAHFFRKLDMGSLSDDEETGPGRPILSTIFLLILPLAVFAAFLLYLNQNGSNIHELLDRARDRMRETADGYAAPTRAGGYHKLLGKVTHFRDFKEWFLDLFTGPALLLAALGLVTWRVWSRRLSIASGETARRAAFRLLACLLLTQALYTGVFPGGAVVHEFWQYYLVVPVAILVAGFCTWLTVAGGRTRAFRFGVFDRLAWSVAALIPLAAIGPIAYRFQTPPRLLNLLGKSEPAADYRLNADYTGRIAELTRPGDVILTDLMQERPEKEPRGLGYALPWYTDRTILPHEGKAAGERDTRSIEGINQVRQKYKDRRILYLWDNVGPDALEHTLNTQFKQFEFDRAIVFLIQGEPDPSWKLARTTLPTEPAGTPKLLAPSPATRPSTTKPAP